MEKQRENQRVMLTKRLLRESLTRLLKTESIHKISIRMLCEEAGVNRSTFYKYYGSQYDLLGELEDELLEQVRSAIEGADSDRARIERICAYLEGHMDSVRVLVGNNVDPHFPEKLFGLPEIYRMIFERLGGRYDAEERNYVYMFIISGVYRMIQEWMTSGSSKSFMEVAFLMEELIGRICGTEPHP